MDQSERARLRALCETATPGPWECNGVSVDPEDGYVFARQGANIRGTPIVLDDTYERCGSDMLFVAASRTAIPALLDDLDAVERERDEARAEVKDLRTALEYFGGRDDARIADLERAASSLSDEVTQRRFERDTATRERDALRSLREMDAERVAALEEALRATLSRWRATRGRYTPLPHCDVCGVRLAADGTETHDAECAVGRDLRVLGGGAT